VLFNRCASTKSITYDKDNRPKKITSQVTDKNNTYNAGLVSANYSYDVYGRNNSTVYKHGEDTSVLTRTIRYVNPSDTTTTSIIHTLNNHTDLYDKTYTYTYDAQGNITSISNGTGTITYKYDKLNQLIRENNPITGETWEYTYDLGGNITSKTKYDYTTAANPTNGEDPIVYVYGDPNWPDLLTEYNDQEIESDAIGNMLSDGTWSYEWQHGRQLDSMSNGTTTVNFDYDASGMRIRKAIGTNVWRYTYNGSTLSYMTDGTNELFFSYDSTGPMAVKYNGTDYYYVLNAQGDVIALVNSSGSEVVSYTYGPWGELLSTGGSMASTLGQHNPLRYRGYVYDDETGLYYLQSRYYNPEMGRFINTDTTDILTATPNELTDKNLFAYCDNNPVVRVDYGGEFWDTVFKVAAAVTVTAVTVMVIVGTGGIGAAPILAAASTLAGTAVSAGTVITAAASVAVGGTATMLFAKHNDRGNSRNPTSRNQMQKQVTSKQAPKEVDRVDPPHVNAPKQQNHIHFKDGTAINMDGSLSHESRGIPKITKAILEWIIKNGWGLPKF